MIECKVMGKTALTSAEGREDDLFEKKIINSKIIF